MTGEIVGDLHVESTGVLRPLVEKLVERFERDKQMLGRSHFGPSTGELACGMDEIGGTIGSTTLLARIAVLVGGMTLGACASHEAVGQKHAGHGIVELLDLARCHKPTGPQRLPHFTAALPIGLAIGATVVIEGDLKACKVGEVSLSHSSDQILFAATLGPRANHDGRAMRVISAEIDRAMAAELLEPHKDVGLNVFDQMPEVDVAVGVRERGGDEDSAAA